LFVDNVVVQFVAAVVVPLLLRTG